MTEQELCLQYKIFLDLLKNGKTDEVIKMLEKVVRRIDKQYGTENEIINFCEEVNKMGDTDKQFNAKLIEDYYYNLELRKIAEKEGATETVKKINLKLEMIKLQLQPLELREKIDD